MNIDNTNHFDNVIILSVRKLEQTFVAHTYDAFDAS